MRPTFVFGLLFCSTAIAQTTAGFTPGSFRVTESGAAEYRIALRVPPGIAGIEPKLALVYNSQAGNGLLGVGWALEGLSAITRCPRTMAQDGVRGSVNYDANDRFCLDGRRLMAVSGAYGADGTEYRTELESFSKIVSYGAAGDGPAWFKVWRKGGEILEYGNTADSRIEAQGRTTARAWALGRISDRAGNYLSATYTENPANGEYVLERIDYGGNSSALPATAPGGSVRLVHEARPDVRSGYVAGSKNDSTLRLSRVRTYLGAALVREYQLSYHLSPTTSRSRLGSVSECDSGATCLGATTLAWQNATPGWTSAPAYAPPTAISHFEAAYGNIDYGVRIVDVNGDGLPDYLQCETAGHCKAWINTGAGWQQNNAYAPPTAISHFEAAYGNIDYGVRIVDVTGDGLPDYLQCETTGHCKAWVNTGSGWQQNNAYAPPTAISHFEAAYGNINYGVQIVDVNGDGLPDYLQCETAGHCKAWINTGAGWQQNNAYAPPTAISHFEAAYGNIDYGVRIVDVTGDGLPDYLQCETAGHCKAWVNTGSGWQQNNAYAPPTAISHFEAAYGNINYGVQIVDVTGDDLPDYLQCETSGSCNAWKLSGPYPDLLSDIAAGASTSIAYASLTAPAVYEKGSGASFPVLELQMPWNVVATSTSASGAGGPVATAHRYGGLRTELGSGRGLLGFRWTERTSAETGLKLRSEYRQDWPYVGLPSLVKSMQASGALLSQTLNTHGSTSPATGVYFPFVSQSVESGNDLNGAPLPTVTTSVQYDSFGNPAVATVSTPDGHSKTTTNTFTNDAASWRLGRLTRSTVQSTGP